MQSTEDIPHEPPLPSTDPALPRRASPEKAITLRHHQLARDASLKASHGSVSRNQSSQDSSSPGRALSEESNEIGQSDVEEWFNQADQNPTATFDSGAMNVDPPFFQKKSDSSNEDKPYHFQSSTPRNQFKARSSSADDYRSIIDDLTMEIQKLKGELKRYKQRGPDVLRKDRLFEIKIHGLPKMEKRELEVTLREFITTVRDSPDTSSSQRNKKSSKHASRARMYYGAGYKSQSKHASLSSGSESDTQLIDSAYASMSTGACSSGTSLNRPQGGSQFKSNEQKVENYLRDIPEGLCPRFISMTNKQKKKLVVRRLEQIFTGKIGGKYGCRSQLCQAPAMPVAPSAQVTAVDPSSERPMVQEPKLNVNANPSANLNPAPETMREAQTLLQEHQSRQTGKNSRSQDMGSASNSNEDQTEREGNGNGHGSGNGSRRNPSLRMPPEQRSTRSRDLDPDRAQISSENMEYIRHLVLVPPESTATQLERPNDGVHPDEVGWVYLNLLCNIAQLHIMNVTPDFVRNAVVDLSTKFQLSPDGRKIRWRGGTDGTKFSSDSSGDISQWSLETDDTENTKGDHHKRKKTGLSGHNLSKLGPQVSASSESFHYKPLFHHQQSPNEQSSMRDSTLSFFGPTEESNADSWGQSGSGAFNHRKLRRDGTIIYYSGAPFCTDLSGDPGDISPTTYMLPGGRERLAPQVQFVRPMPFRSGSGSSMNRRPLSDTNLDLGSMSKKDVNDGAGMPELVTESGDESREFSMEFPWSDAQQILEVHPLEPCGLGGVLPEDHFMVMVTTRRSKIDAYVNQRSGGQHKLPEERTDNITNSLATMSTSSPPSIHRLLRMDNSSKIKIEYLSGRIWRLEPVPLPPPAIFFPPLNADSWSEDGFGSDGDDELTPSEEFLS